MAVWQNGNLAKLQFGKWQFGNLAIWQFGNLAKWQFGKKANLLNGKLAKSQAVSW